MRVLHVLNELLASGAEVMLREAAPYWHDIDSHVLATEDEVGPFAPDLREAGFTVHHLPFAKRPRFAVDLYRLLRQHKPDVLHIHTERANLLYVLVARFAGIRAVVRTVHSSFAFEGRLRRVRRAQRGLARRLGVVHVSIGPLVQSTERTVFGNETEMILNWYSPRFVPVSPEERRALRSQLGIPEEAFVIVTVGNCAPVKNHGALIEALGRLAGRLDFVYVHVGREEAGRPELALAKTHGLAEHVRFEGLVRDPAPYLQAADVFVMPSLKEGMPIAALEALACGLPAVLSDVPGLTQLRAMTSAPFWASPTAEGLAPAIAHVHSLPLAERRAAGREASQSVRHHFGVERGAKEYRELYRRVAEEKGKARPRPPYPRT